MSGIEKNIFSLVLLPWYNVIPKKAVIKHKLTKAGEMMYIADLHIHSLYSRATSKNCSLEYLDLWARRKGIGILGTGDFTHPAWRE